MKINVKSLDKNRPYKNIELKKLKQINYIQRKIIEDRIAKNELDGVQLKPSFSIGADLFKLIDQIKIDALKYKNHDKNYLGMSLYIATLHKLPIEKVKELERQTSLEIQFKTEMQRVKLNQGNIDRIIKKASGGAQIDYRNEFESRNKKG